MKVGDFFVELGVKADNPTLKSFVSTLGQLPLEAAASILALAGVDFALLKIAQGALEASVSFQLFSAETNLSWQELQRWQIAAEQANVSGQTVTSSIMGLQKSIAAIHLGQGDISPFAFLGIDPNQSPFAILTQLHELVKSGQVDIATVSLMMSKMGVSPDMLPLLRLTDAEFNKLAKSSMGMSEAQEKQFLRMKQSLVQLMQTVRYAGYDIVEMFGPPLERAVREVLPHINNIAKAITGTVEALEKFPFALQAIGLALAVIGSEMAPITTAIAALFLLMDDYETWKKGGNSKFGDIYGMTANTNTLGPKMLNHTFFGEAMKDIIPAMIAATLNPAGNGGVTVDNSMTNHFHGDHRPHEETLTGLSNVQRNRTRLQTDKAGH